MALRTKLTKLEIATHSRAPSSDVERLVRLPERAAGQLSADGELNNALGLATCKPYTHTHTKQYLRIFVVPMKLLNFPQLVRF